MSKYAVGDKVLVEGEIKRIDSGESYEFPYKVLIAGLERINFSEDELRHATKTYEDGLNDAWELARKLYCDIKSHELKEIFDCKSNHYVDASIVFGWILKELTPQEALAKIEAQEKSKQIQVGDVVYAQGIKGVVIDDCTEDSDDTCYVFCENGNVEDWKFVDLKKTGRHIDIEHLIEQIRGDQ